MPKKRKPASAPKRLMDSVGNFLAGAASTAGNFFDSLEGEKKKGSRVFVYGGHGGILDPKSRVGDANLVGYRRIQHQGRVAIVRAPGTVQGQVYEVDRTTMLLLTQQYGPNTGFRRQQVRLDDGSLAWTYVYVGQSR